MAGIKIVFDVSLRRRITGRSDGCTDCCCYVAKCWLSNANSVYYIPAGLINVRVMSSRHFKPVTKTGKDS